MRAHEATRKAISLTDPANYTYSTTYLVDIDSAIILGVEASPSTLSEEAQIEKGFGVKP